MKSRTILLGLMLLALLCAIAIPARAQAGNADFQQAVAAYQQSPSDATAEKVIRMAAAMDQLPPIPEEARRHFVRGTALFKDAKSPDDYKQVVDEFTQAIRIAPWWPDARYNRALAREAAGDYANAITALKLYLLFKLPEADARAAQDKIYALEAKQEKAGKAASEQAAAEQRAEQQREGPKVLLGQLKARYEGVSYHGLYCAVGRAEANGGCNKTEYSGSNWYDLQSVNHRFLFPDDGTIRFVFSWNGSAEELLRGTPKGPTLGDIVWEQQYNGVYVQVWLKLLDGLDKFVFSGNKDVRGPARPADESLFNPDQRYGYRIVNRQ